SPAPTSSPPPPGGKTNVHAKPIPRCSLGENPQRCIYRRTSVQASVIVFANYTRRDFSRLDGHWLVHDPLTLGVVTHFHMPGEREVLAEGMPNKTVIGQDATQVVVSIEHDTEQVEGFALEPV